MNSLVRSVVILFALGSLRLLAQGTPLGPEFQVNTYTTNTQYAPAVSTLTSGGFVVVWHSLMGPSLAYDVKGQHYSSGGAPSGGEFAINTYTTSSQSRPAVAALPGGFVVVWQSYTQDGSAFGVFGQRFDGTGAPVGASFLVNSYTTLSQISLSIASGAGGAFVVAWTSQSQDGSYLGVFGQRFGGSATPLGTEFRVNTYTPNNQDGSSIASDAAGNFVVVWGDASPQDGSSGGVFGQRYASSGAPLGGEFRVNSYTTGAQFAPSVAAASDGTFVVVWSSVGQDGGAEGVFGQRFASSGAPLGGEFRVNTYTTNAQAVPSVASGANGSFVVVWGSNYQFGAVPAGKPARREGRDSAEPLGGIPSGAGVFGQTFSSSGTPTGAEFRVNSYTSQGQANPRVAADSAGNFVVVWVSNIQDGSGAGIFGQRYCVTLTNVSIAVAGPTSICPGGTGGTATVADTGGGPVAHQWGYRTTTGGPITNISIQTGPTYTLNASDFSGPGPFLLVCTTTPPVSCGAPLVSNEVAVQVGDPTTPVVTPPPASTTTQTLCQ